MKMLMIEKRSKTITYSVEIKLEFRTINLSGDY